MLRNLRKEFAVSVGAGEAAIRIDTDEIDDALKTISDACKKHGWELRVFDVLVGVKWHVGEPADKKVEAPKTTSVKSLSPGDLLNAFGGAGATQPVSVLQVLTDFWNEAPKPDTDPKSKGEIQPVILVIKNFHLGFEGRREPMAALIQHLVGDKVSNHRDYEKLRKSVYDVFEIPGDSDTGKFIVGLMPAEARLPAEVDPLFKKLVHELPDEEELGNILDGVAPVGTPDGDDEDNGSGLSLEDRKKVCKFALGLTRLQAEGVFSACLVTHARIVPSYVWQAKSEILNKEGLVELHQGKEKFKDVAGLEGAKEYLKRLLTPDEYDDADPDVRAKGVLFVGAPGCLHPETLIPDPVTGTVKTVRERYEDGDAFHVTARRDDGCHIIAKAEAPHKYEISPMVEVVFASGRRITVTPEHRFWDGTAYVSAREVSERLQESVRVLLPTTAVRDQTV